MLWRRKAAIIARKKKATIPEGAKTKNMFGFVHYYDDAAEKWVRIG
jgi:hypothetical protein